VIRFGDVTFVSGAFTCSAGFQTWKLIVRVLTKLSEPSRFTAIMKFVGETLICFSLTVVLAVAATVLKGFSSLNALLNATAFDESAVTMVCESDCKFTESVCAKAGTAATNTTAIATVNLEIILCLDMVTFSF
jgi:hypothetical protein